MQPKVTQTTHKSQFGADLPARIYSAEQGQSRFSATVVDYSNIEAILAEKAKSCPAGAERDSMNAAAAIVLARMMAPVRSGQKPDTPYVVSAFRRTWSTACPLEASAPAWYRSPDRSTSSRKRGLCL